MNAMSMKNDHLNDRSCAKCLKNTSIILLYTIIIYTYIGSKEWKQRRKMQRKKKWGEGEGGERPGEGIP